MSIITSRQGAGRSNIAGVIKANHEWSGSCRTRCLRRRRIRHRGSRLNVDEVVHNDLPVELQADCTNVLQLQTSHYDITHQPHQSVTLASPEYTTIYTVKGKGKAT